ncbi:MAG: C40 family peptidase [Muribaculaceae bacterium]|nr:C40 family peptidase [Muribaculaceae bacterium]MDE5844808.1 C40 family peptidase [Muribaculaceae bacterium]MDE7368736.1 C40 family peptidase [Muribaculaceae bacterium]
MKTIKSIAVSLFLSVWSFNTFAAQPVNNDQKTLIKQLNNSDLIVENRLYDTSSDQLVIAAGMELLFSDELDNELSIITGDLIATAKKFLGTQYRSGGKTPAGFDCSGFTSFIFNQFGYKLAASSSAQFNDGKQINNHEIIPGDLLFFNGREIGSRIGHVGIAISEPDDKGVVTFIHSASSGGIRIDKTSSPYYNIRYKGARRVIL